MFNDKYHLVIERCYIYITAIFFGYYCNKTRSLFVLTVTDLDKNNLKRREYNSIVNEHSNNLFGYAIKFLRNREDAKDIVQDVFEKLWLNRKKVEIEKAKSWMFTTAHNAMINFSNRKGRVQLTEEFSVYDKGIAPCINAESNEVVERAVSILPPIQKSVILLRDLEGYSYKEIGGILDLTDSQVKVYLFRGRKKIKKQLKGMIELV